MKASAFIVAAFLALSAKAECPPYNQVPTMHPSSDEVFNCARYYTGVGDLDPIQGCNSCYDWEDGTGHDIADGTEFSAPEGSAISMGSVFVKPGCTLTGFSGYNYEGDIQELHGLVSLVTGFHDFETCGKGFNSYKCRCEQKLPSCTPTDAFDTVVVCDATNANATSQCVYSKSIGSVYSDETSNSMSISTDISYQMQVSMSLIFSAELGASLETGYDWSKSTATMVSRDETFEVVAEIPPGLILTVEQAVGYCGDDSVRTELFRITHTDVNGKVVRKQVTNELHISN